jgi:DHA1 family multidrug resistance protein-like MFS transporter
MRRLTLPAWFSLSLCLALINFLSNISVELSNVYLALYARSIGSSNLQVGFIAAAMGIAFLISSLVFGRLSDIHGRMKFIRAGLGLTSVAFFFQALAHDPWALVGARSFVGFCVGINSAVIMAYTYEQQKRIGSFISYGALGWLVGAMLAALVKDYDTLFILSSAVAFLPFLMSFLLTEDKESATRIHVAAFPLHLIKSNYKIFLAFFLRQLGGMAIGTVWPLYLSSIGASKFWISVMDSTNMLGQFFAMRYIEKFNPARMFQLGLIVSVIVFALYGVATHYLQVIPVQLLLSVGYSALFIGALNYLLRRHRERGTVAGLLNSSMSLSGSIGPFLGGALSQAWGYGAVMYASAAISFLGLLASRGINAVKDTKTSDNISGKV